MARMTVKTLAAAVGVSPATISNAYNRPDQLSAELRERILATAKELGYPGPDAAGRILRIGRAEAVGVLLSERLSYAFSDPFAVEFLTGLSEVVEEHGISIVLMPLSARTDDPTDVRNADDRDLTAVRNANIDALAILSLPTDHPAAVVARARGIRLVTTDISSDPESSWVAIDDFAAGVAVGEHLARLGHRDVAVLVETNQPAGSPGRRLQEDELGFLDYAARVAGLQQALAGQVMIISGGHNSTESGATATLWLLDHRLPTAIVGLSDVLALGSLQALASRGRDVPAEVSVCGFDDIAAAHAAYLTTVHQPIREKGQHVGRLLIDPASQPRQVLLPVNLVTRATTGQARKQ
jgi:DNA-binding LacI/PurR family transcriptional regulator